MKPLTLSEDERFNPNRPGLCSHLRWKGMFVPAEDDPTVPRGHGGLFWCLYTQTCLGPDGGLAEPGTCSSPSRACHGKGRVE
jgi:hypothetical protein